MNIILIPIAVLSTLGFSFGIILGYASCRFVVYKNPLIEKIDALLPQIQCGQCGYPSCYPYAEAMLVKQEKINRCSPGGEALMLKIAELLNIDPQPINSSKVKDTSCIPAMIDEINCIGCSKCIQVCPVDAIIGARHVIHTVIADLCIGCNLCTAICPTKCIKLRSVEHDY